jgi:CHAT domain
VAQLKLNADWVVLSASNTAAADKPGAEAPSGLARAFFYAGAQALLVSHWSVDSQAATRLTTSTFAIMKANPKRPRGGPARRDADLHERQVQPAEWLPGILGAAFHHRRGNREMSETADMLRVLRKRRFGMLLSVVTGLMVSLTVALARAPVFLIAGGVARNESAHRFPYGHVYAQPKRNP